MKYPTCTILLVNEEEEVIQMAGIVIGSHLVKYTDYYTILHETVDINGTHRLLTSDELYYDYEELKAL